jgi:hypothetical protein
MNLPGGQKYPASSAAPAFMESLRDPHAGHAEQNAKGCNFE